MPFFEKIIAWWRFSLSSLQNQSTLHRAVQYVFLLFFCWVGIQFFRHVLWAFAASGIYVPRPPSVEAFLPIGAFLAFKRLLLTGQYDMVHPAGLTIFIFALAVSLLLRRAFCGYLCPIGTLAFMAQRLGTRLGISYQPGRVMSFILSLPKYGLMLWISWRLVLSMELQGIEAFLGMHYWRVADTKMLLYFWPPSTGLILGLLFFSIGSIIIPGFWCRGFCPYGALLGIFSSFSPVAVKRNASLCTGCGRCSRACPARIPVQTKTRISGPECVGCGECVASCNIPHSLAFAVGYTRKAKTFASWRVPAMAVILLALLFGWAVETGHWFRTERLIQIRMDHMPIRPSWL